MTIEEKAKRYAEVVNKLRHFITQGVDPLITRADVQDFFPELKEPEDEMIRKELIQFIKNWKDPNNIGRPHDFPTLTRDVEQCDKYIAWLEKQGFQKPTDEEMKEALRTEYEKGRADAIAEMKPADKVGHLIPQKGVYYVCIKDYCPVVSNYSVNTKDKIYKSPRNGYINNDKGVGLSWTNSCTENYFRPVKEEDWIVCEQNNVIGKPLRYKEFMSELIQKNIKSLEDKGIVPNFRLWDIFDAKDGDVLADEDNNIGIFKECEGIYWNSYIYLGCDGTLRGFSIGGKHEQNNTRPATKEQCDLLFSKMKEAGYEWSDEDRKLIKIVK